MGLKKKIDELVKKNRLEEALDKLKKYSINKEKPYMEKYVINLSRQYYQDQSSYNLGLLSYEEYRKFSTQLAAAILNVTRAREDDDNFAIEECQMRIEHSKIDDKLKLEITIEAYKSLLKDILKDPGMKIINIEQGSIIISFLAIRYAFRRLIRAYDSGRLQKKFKNNISYIKTFEADGMEKEMYVFKYNKSNSTQYKAYIVPTEESDASAMIPYLKETFEKFKARVSELSLELNTDLILNQYFTKPLIASYIIVIAFSRDLHQKHLLDKIMQQLNSNQNLAQKLITKT